jgi:Na+/melibiose symporter-like transporter
LRYVLTNRAYVFLLIIFATSAMGSAMTNTLSVFFVKHVLGVEELYGYYLAPYFICQMAGIPLWMKLSRKIGKHKATMWAIGWYALWSSFIPLITLADNDLFTTFRVQSLLAFLPSDTYQTYMAYFEGIDTGKHLWFLVVMCLKGSAIGALSALPAAMCADVIDVDTAQTGKRQGGAYFSIWSMVQKWSYAFGITIGLSLVVWWGFDEHADPKSGTNTAFTLLMLACVYSVIPALFKFVGMPLLWMYPLTEEKVSEVQGKIAENERSSPNVSA